LSAAAWRQTLSSPALMSALGITVVSAAGQFVLFSYMAPYVFQRFDTTPTQFSLMLVAYGGCGFLGNALLSRHIDRIGAERAMGLALTSIAVGMALVSQTQAFGWMVAAILPWGLGVFASNSAQQARLVGIAPALASASVALNTSAMYLGQAIGATFGGWLILHQGLSVLPGIGSLGLLMALGMSLWAARMARRHPVRVGR
jgi:predicted MFS family arabinose efflux permease